MVLMKKVAQMELYSVAHWDYVLVESLAYDWVALRDAYLAVRTVY